MTTIWAFCRLSQAMDYQKLFDTVRAYLDGHKIVSSIHPGRKVGERALANAEQALGIGLPAELRTFYQTMGNGFSFSWYVDFDDLKQPHAGVSVPTLTELTQYYHGWREGALYSPQAAETYGFPYTKNPTLAKQTAARMWHWLPVLQEGNGDHMSIDLSKPAGPVVFDQHDWLDGGSGDNGVLLGSDWADFLTRWGSVCFQQPKNSYWPSAFRATGKMDWEGTQFDQSFRISGLTA